MFFAILSTIVAKNLVRTRVGRAFIAIRDNDLAAEVMGINVFAYKLLAFFIGCVFAGVAGSLLVHFVRYAFTAQFTFLDSVWYLGMLIAGGMGSISGGHPGGHSPQASRLYGDTDRPGYRWRLSVPCRPGRRGPRSLRQGTRHHPFRHVRAPRADTPVGAHQVIFSAMALFSLRHLCTGRSPPLPFSGCGRTGAGINLSSSLRSSTGLKIRLTKEGGDK